MFEEDEELAPLRDRADELPYDESELVVCDCAPACDCPAECDETTGCACTDSCSCLCDCSL